MSGRFRYMEIRKLQTTAGGTFMITMPREWVNKLRLKKGDLVSVELEAGDMIISPANSRAEQQSHPLEISEFRDKKMLDLCVTASYMVGHDVTEVVSNRKVAPEQKRWIRETVDGLLGLEISEEFSNQVVLQNLVDPTKFDLFRSIERFSATSRAVFNDAIKSLAEDDIALAQDAYDRGKESTKTYRLLFRLALQAANDKKLRVHMRLPNISAAVVVLQSVRELGRIAYYSMRIAQHVQEMKKRPEKPLVSAISDMATIVSGMQEQATKSFLAKDFNAASNVMDRIEKVRNLNESAFLQLLREKDEKSSMAITLIVRDIRNIASYASALAEDAILAAFN